MSGHSFSNMNKLIVFVFLLFTLNTSAQSIFGVKAGGQLTNLDFSDPSGFTHFNLFFVQKYSFHGGIFLRFPVYKKLHIQTELLYSVKGAREVPNYPFKFNLEDRNLIFINLPILAHLPLYKGFALQGGAEMGVLLNKSEERYRNKTADLGLLAGVSKTFFQKFELSIRYVHGVTPIGVKKFEGLNLKIEDNTFTVKTFNRMLQASFAYYIKSKKESLKVD